MIAKKDDSVKVEFKFHKTAGPKEGDKVTFFTKLDEIQVGVGSGKVVSIDIEGIWVEVTDNNPLPSMQAVVQA